ncbi:phosphodiester glycosidase family protein [Actinospica sp. MGRD01-02]|uniref:Phosphodiester glycosidase family protein n=1 Tax=Actinospica acidithermotolerans TaxID=2828514 RepID=A0A941IKN9_9ACTN|nr:phosphodiester glycosidase family protein [Actinospica acidithermotolerans]MBR7826886.1 phosphodiester glycosidase family protein [Actinospica acidithermotolerans]
MNPVPEPDASVAEVENEAEAQTAERRPDGEKPQDPKKARRKRRRRYVLRGLLAVFVLVVGYVGVTLPPYLTAPGTDPFAARVAEWARDHHMGMLVTWLENETYTAPATGGKLNSGQLAQLKSKNQDTSGTRENLKLAPADSPANITPFASGSVPGEGVFSPAVIGPLGNPIVETAALRPDAEHTSNLAYVAWLNQHALSFTLNPGYDQPGGTWAEPDYISPSMRDRLVATWNGGFKVSPDDAMGGFYEDGRTAVPLVDGKAAEVFYKDGTLKIGAWGRDLSMTPDVAAVRENLNLLVDDGNVTVGEYDGSGADWGYTIRGWYYIARSGVGVTAKGDIVYVGGTELSVYTLAKLLKAAGAVYGMELDINPDWTSFMTYDGLRNPQNLTATKLWDFNPPADRYFSPSDRDFVSVHAR